MMILLLISCIMTPFEIAFPNDNAGNVDTFKYIIDKIFDVLFLIDSIVTF